MFSPIPYVFCSTPLDRQSYSTVWPVFPPQDDASSSFNIELFNVHVNGERSVGLSCLIEGPFFCFLGFFVWCCVGVVQETFAPLERSLFFFSPPRRMV